MNSFKTNLSYQEGRYDYIGLYREPMVIFAYCTVACFRETGIALSISNTPLLEVLPHARCTTRCNPHWAQELQYVLIQFKLVLT